MAKKSMAKIVVVNSLLGQWNTTFFAFSMIIEGTTEKAFHFIMPLKSIYNGFIEQKMYF